MPLVHIEIKAQQGGSKVARSPNEQKAQQYLDLIQYPFFHSLKRFVLKSKKRGTVCHVLVYRC